MADRNVTAKEVWEILRQAQNRVVGFFDSCMSGSMIVDPSTPAEKGQTMDYYETDPEIAKVDGEVGVGSFAQTVADLFKDDMQRRGNCCEEVGPQIRLYSACANGVITTYEPEIGTKFADAISMCHRKTEGKTYAEFDELLIEKSTYGPKTNPQYRVVP